MANSADPDQLASTDLDLHCLQKQGISGFSRTRVNMQCNSFETIIKWLNAISRSLAQTENFSYDNVITRADPYGKGVSRAYADGEVWSGPSLTACRIES